MTDVPETERPKYRISVISERLGMHPQTIRTYEKLELISPARSKGNTRLFSDRDVQVLEKIQTLTRDMGVNLAGVDVILRMLRQMETMQKDAQELVRMMRNILETHGIDRECNLDDILDQFEWLKPDTSNTED